MVCAIHAQYMRMIEQNHTWRCKDFGRSRQNFTYTIGEESTYNSVIYKNFMDRLWKSGACFYGFMIEDTYTETVYFVDNEQIELLYDLGVEVNDVLLVLDVNGMQSITISEIATLEVNGTNRRKVSFFQSTECWLFDSMNGK